MLDPTMDISDYDFHLPDSLIAQEAIYPAHNTKLLHYKDDTYSDYLCTDIPKLLPTNTTIIYNDSKVIKARIPIHNKQCIRPRGGDPRMMQRKNNAPRTSLLWETGEILIYELMHSKQGLDTYIAMTKTNNIRLSSNYHNFACCIVSDNTHFRPGTQIAINDTITLHSIGYIDNGILLMISGDSITNFLENFGQMPLPPYIAYDKTKESSYQPYVAKDDHQGSIAAPTAGLHFTKELIDNCIKAGHTFESITLHVGLGTFKPVSVDDIRNHHIHQEYIVVPHSLWSHIAHTKTNNKSILAVGTTSARTIESLPYIRSKLSDTQKDIFDETTRTFWNTICQIDTMSYIGDITIHSQSIHCTSSLYILPGFRWRLIDILKTNFHLPKSSLTIMIASYMGYQAWKDIYRYAIEKAYRFYSFGDTMLIYRDLSQCTQPSQQQ